MFSLGVAHLVLVILNLFKKARGIEILDDLLAHVHAVHAHIERTLLGDCTVGIEDVYRLEVVRLAKLVVVHIVSGRHFQATRTELDVNIAVLDDGNNPVN